MAKGLYVKKYPNIEEVDKYIDSSDEKERLITMQKKDGVIYCFYYKIYSKAVDYLNPDTISLFLRTTHEEYYKRFGNDFGKIIPGVFFDEIFMVGEPLPWTDHLPEEFIKQYGYDLIPLLPSLVTGEDEIDYQVRKDYYALLATLYEKAFFKQISDWCKNHNIDLVGHTEEFLWEQPRRQGNYFQTMRNLMVPGSDCHDYRYQYPRKITLSEPKYAVSVARAYKKERAMSEALGGAGWNTTPEEIRRGIHTLAAMGINMFILHGFYYECNHQGSQSDWPTSFFYQNPYWRYFNCISDEIRRISYINSIGYPVVRYAIYYPIETLSKLMEGGNLNIVGQQISKCFHEIFHGLLNNQMDIDMSDRESILKSVINGKKLQIGNQKFEALLFPEKFEFDNQLNDKLTQWKEKGGNIFYYPVSNKMQNSEIAGLIKKIQDKVHSDVKIIAGKAKEIYVNCREIDKKNVFFISNSSTEKRILSIELCRINSEILQKGGNIYILDPENGEYSIIQNFIKQEQNKVEDGVPIRFELTLDSSKALFIVVDFDYKKGMLKKNNYIEEYNNLQEKWITGKWEFIPIDESIRYKSPKDTFDELNVDEMILSLPLASFSSDAREGNEIIRINSLDGKVDGGKNHISLWNAKWITRRPSWNDQLNATELYFCKDFEINENIIEAKFCIAAIDSYQLYINDTLVLNIESNGMPRVIQVTKYLMKGKNRILVYVQNHYPLYDVNICSAEDLPTDREISLLLQGNIQTDSGCQQLLSDKTWLVTDQKENILSNSTFINKDKMNYYFDVQNVKNFNKETAEHDLIYAWERGKPPLLPWGDLPLFEKTVSYPINLYYTIQIPAGAKYIEHPIISGKEDRFTTSGFQLDGKLINLDDNWTQIVEDENSHTLTITVKAEKAQDGLLEPIRVKMKNRLINLEDWGRMGLSWFSGSCRYRKIIKMEKMVKKCVLDLGKVNFCAEIWVNNKFVATRIWSPYLCNITQYLKNGDNEIMIIASNLAGNERRHMLVDSGRSLGWNRYWNEDNMDRDAQNYVSGLIGPVRLIIEPD